jgi:hypothetical protein
LPTATISVCCCTSTVAREGLERLLASEDRLSVTPGNSAGDPSGPRADADVMSSRQSTRLEQLLEWTHSPVVIVMSLHTDKVRVLRLDDLPSRPGDVIDSIVAACLDRPGLTAGGTARVTDAARALQ